MKTATTTENQNEQKYRIGISNKECCSPESLFPSISLSFFFAFSKKVENKEGTYSYE